MDTKDIKGISTIDHKKRALAKLTIAEYAVMQFSYLAVNKAMAITKETVWKHLGIDFQLFITIRKRLAEKGFLKAPLMKMTDKWDKIMGDMDKMFDQFWLPQVINGTVYRWTGSKEDARAKFKIALSQVSLEYLLTQKTHYLTVLNESPFERSIMGCAVFLNPQTKRYNENWYSQTIKGKSEADKEILNKSIPKSENSLDDFQKLIED